MSGPRPCWIFRADDWITLALIALYAVVAVLYAVERDWGGASITALAVWLLLSLRWEQERTTPPMKGQQ